MVRTANSSTSLLKLGKAKWVKRCNYVGIFVLFLTQGFPWYVSNLSAYTQSYFRHYLGPDPEITTPWVMSLWISGMGTALVMAGHIARFIGRKFTMVIGYVIVDSGLFLSTLSVQHSLKSLDISLGLVNGFGTGLVLTLGLEHALSFQTKYPGFVTALILSGIAIGSAVTNVLITWYINPTNLTPDLFERRQKFFTQAEILEKVPSVFILLGATHVCCRIVGTILINVKMVENVEDHGDLSTYKKNAGGVESHQDKPQEVENELTDSRNSMEPTRRYGASLPRNVSPGQMLRLRSFYVLSLTVCCSEYAYMIVANFFKTFGQTKIPDDQFLTFLGTCILLISVVTRPLTGCLIDICGVKLSVIIFCSLSCVCSNFWYFTPMVSRWLYFVWTVVYGSVLSGFYLIFPLATFKLFGEEHFSKNFGVVMFSSVLLSIFVPAIVQTLVTSFGWCCLFLSVGSINTVGVVCAALWLPRQ